MGYFANLYLVEVSRDGGETVVETNIYGGSIDPVTYFSWGAGSAPKGFHSYAGGTIFTEAELNLRNGYPRQERYDFRKAFLLDASYYPRDRNDPVVFHIVLHKYYYPAIDRKPFIQPSDPTIDRDEDKIVITYPIIGPAKVSFWVNTLQSGGSLTDFEAVKVVSPDVKRSGESTYIFDTGIFRRPPETPMTPTTDLNKRFLIALSFPGEYREFVEKVAHLLSQQLDKQRVLYDKFHEAEFARPNLDTHLQALYHDESELLVVFLCADYERKEWTGLEWRAIRDLIKKKQDTSIMFIQLDDANISGLFSIDGYISVHGREPAEIATLILSRLRSLLREHHFEATTRGKLPSSETVPIAYSSSSPEILRVDELSSSQPDRIALKRSLNMARRALSILEEQVAGFGKLHTPVHLQIELEEKRREVAALEARLGS